MSTIEFGLTVPNRGLLATLEGIGALVTKAEESGFVRFAVPDLVVVPTSYASRYPYDASGKLVGYATDCMEQLVLMAHVAAVAKKARILSVVMVAPRRPAVLTAKAVATLDVLSGGRFILTGSDEQVVEDAAALRDLGATRLMFNILRPTLEESFAAIDRFRENVMARLLS